MKLLSPRCETWSIIPLYHSLCTRESEQKYNTHLMMKENILIRLMLLYNPHKRVVLLFYWRKLKGLVNTLKQQTARDHVTEFLRLECFDVWRFSGQRISLTFGRYYYMITAELKHLSFSLSLENLRREKWDVSINSNSNWFSHAILCTLAVWRNYKYMAGGKI